VKLVIEGLQRQKCGLKCLWVTTLLPRLLPAESHNTSGNRGVAVSGHNPNLPNQQGQSNLPPFFPPVNHHGQQLVAYYVDSKLSRLQLRVQKGGAEMVADTAELVAQATEGGILVKIQTPFWESEGELSDELLRRLGYVRPYPGPRHGSAISPAN